MAEIWGVAIVAGATLASGYMSSQAGEAGAQAQENAANASTQEQEREFNIDQQNQQPWLQAGQNALGLEQQYLNGNTSGFENSPDYKFAVQQGTAQLDAGAAANGNLFGGGADADRIALGQGLATQYANNYWNKLAGMSGQGQTSAQNLGNTGTQVASNIGNNDIMSGQARASSYANTANSYSNMMSQFGNIAGYYGSGNYNQGGIGGSGYSQQQINSMPTITQNYD